MIVVRGHLGFGDCLHQRAIVRTLLDMGEEVVLETFYCGMYNDLRLKGLKLLPIQGHPPRVREHARFIRDIVRIPDTAKRVRLCYSAGQVHKHGSILAAQYACANLRMPEKPDFSVPVRDAWRAMARKQLGNVTKPIMVYRPLVLNNLFHCESRLPDVETYAKLYESIRENYHVVSLANLGDYGEHIVGPEMPADTKFHHGHLAFEELVGLFAEAKLVFTCAGYAPVLAQAVGTPVAIVYGGHEGFKTTNSVGAHLAPTLAIEPTNLCECHSGHYTHTRTGLVKPQRNHVCDKTIDIPTALARLTEFARSL